MKRKLIELVISDEGGVDKISLVEEPAIEVDFMYFKKELEKFRFDNDLQIVIGPAMIPDLKIIRVDDKGNYYDVVFSKETILKIAKKFMKEARTNDVNQDHAMFTHWWLFRCCMTDCINSICNSPLLRVIDFVFYCK